MAYSTIANLTEACGGTAKYVQLTDKNSTGVAVDSVGTAAIVEADALIDSYANKRFEVPFANPSPIIASLSSRLAAWNLRRGKPGSTITGEEITLHEHDLEWLSKLSRGEVTPGINPTPTKSELTVDEAGERASTKSVSRERTKGFW